MERWQVEIVGLMLTLLTVGGFSTLIAGLTFRHRRLMKGEGNADLNALHDELAQLREESNGQIAELHERLDFAERLLAQQRDPALPPAPPPPKAQLRPRTPV